MLPDQPDYWLDVYLLKMKNSNTKEHIFLPFYVVSRRTKIPGIVEMF
jgi:hypothetical protein